eukprot:392319_1
MHRNTFWLLDTHGNCEILHELRSICLIYFGFVIDRTILSEYKRHKFTQYLSNHFNLSNQNFRLRLLYRATGSTHDGNTMRLFCNKDTRHLLILLKNSQQHVFGGYTSFGRIEITVPLVCRNHIRSTTNNQTTAVSSMDYNIRLFLFIFH